MALMSDLALQIPMKHNSSDAKPLQRLSVNLTLHVTCWCMHSIQMHMLCICAFSACCTLYACDTVFSCVHMLSVQLLYHM